jgi:hypothetical protein
MAVDEEFEAAVRVAETELCKNELLVRAANNIGNNVSVNPTESASIAFGLLFCHKMDKLIKLQNQNAETLRIMSEVMKRRI